MKSLCLKQEQINFLVQYLQNDMYELTTAINSLLIIINNSYIYNNKNAIIEKRNLLVKRLTTLGDIITEINNAKEIKIIQ